jgi:hypothetical protein
MTIHFFISLIDERERESEGEYEIGLPENREREMRFSFLLWTKSLCHDLHGGWHDQCSPLIVNIDENENERPEEVVKTESRRTLQGNETIDKSRASTSTHLLEYPAEPASRDIQSLCCIKKIDSTIRREFVFEGSTKSYRTASSSTESSIHTSKPRDNERILVQREMSVYI